MYICTCYGRAVESEIGKVDREVHTSIFADISSDATTRVTHAWRKTLRRYKGRREAASGQEKRDRMAAVGRSGGVPRRSRQ